VLLFVSNFISHYSFYEKHYPLGLCVCVLIGAENVFCILKWRLVDWPLTQTAESNRRSWRWSKYSSTLWTLHMCALKLKWCGVTCSLFCVIALSAAQFGELLLTLMWIFLTCAIAIPIFCTCTSTIWFFEVYMLTAWLVVYDIAFMQTLKLVKF